MRRSALLLIVLIAGCGITARDGQFTCPDGVCPEGMVCAADRVCRRDADAEVPDLDASLDAPLTDGSVDVLDAPMVDESCAPSAARVPLDEDADGRIDEGCPYFFGEAHPVLAAMSIDRNDANPLGYAGAQVTDDGRFLFTVAVTGVAGPFSIARRTSVGAPFAPATPAAGSMDATLSPSTVTVTGDGTEVYLQMTGLTDGGTIRIYRSTGSPTGTWTSPTLVSELDLGSELVDPFVRRDGLELFFTSRTGSVGTIYVSTRASRGEPWGALVEVGPGAFPSLGADGLTLFFLDAVADELRFTSRATQDDAFSIRGGSEQASLTTRSGIAVRPAFSPSTREVFFSLQPDSTGTPPIDGPLPRSVFRAEFCRDAACTPSGVTGCTGIPSTDGFHCYTAAGSSTYAAAPSRCGVGEHLVSVHSSREAMTVRSNWLNAWLGIQGTRWQSGEPYLYEEFGTDPTGSECAHTGVGWPLVMDCSGSRTTVCERDLWPVFVD